MSCKTLMVHPEPGRPNTDLPKVSAEPGERFQPGGVAACEVPVPRVA